MIKEGVFLGKRYEILNRIGSGGMADVYKGKDHKLNRFVAVKVLKSDFRNDEVFIQKFLSEAQAAAGLMHPNVVNVYDVGQDRGLYFMVMELVEGITLKDYIHKKGKLSPKETISISIQMVQGIQAAHDKHIIHRDIKPQNIIISKEGKVKVTDFGIARASTATHTVSTSVMGSVHYTSPEHARGAVVNERSDIYSAGITMYEMVTGHVPFDGESTVTVALKHLQEDVVPPVEFVPDIPYSLECIILKCTQKEPEDRYADCAELIQDLKRSLVEPEGDFVVLPYGVASAATAAKAANPTDQTVLMSDTELQRVQASAGEGDEGRPGANERRPQRNNREGRPPNREGRLSPEERAARERREARENRANRANGESRRSREEREEKDSRTKKDSGGRLDGYYDYDDDDKLDSSTKKIMKVLLLVAGIVIAIGILWFLVEHAGNCDPSGFFDSSIEDDNDEEETVEVPDLVGLTLAQARQMLREQNLRLGVEEHGQREESETYGEGQIIRQSYEVGEEVPINTIIRVVISAGLIAESVIVPDVEGMEEAAARQVLQAADLEVAAVARREFSDDVEEGEVIRTNPRANAEVAVGTVVHLYISLGPEETLVPDIVRQTEENARRLIEEADLIVGTVTRAPHDDIPEGQVISSNPPARTSVAPNTRVNFVLSSGEERPTMPTVTGMNESAARNAIGGANLTGTINVEQEYSDRPAGEVISQNPAAGTEVARDATITLVISRGAEATTVPSLAGLNEQQARSAITGAGLAVGDVSTEPSATVAAGHVIRQTPAAGGSAARGSTVGFVLSTGPEMVAVPNIVGQASEAARTAITGAGLTVGAVTEQHHDTVAAGHVISQTPGAGAQAARGSAVSFVVSQGPPPPP